MDNLFINALTYFGLTKIESTIYQELLSHGQLSGYELVKETGISRSNVYSSLSSLVDKGCCYLIEGESTKYVPVEINQFLENSMRELSKKADYLKTHAPKKVIFQEGYITILGAANIRNKIREMLLATELRLYIMAPAAILSEFDAELQELITAGKKVVILSDNYKLKGAKVYETKPEEGQLRFITDSAYVLTGELTGSTHDSALYSGQKNLVSVMKEALKNKIILLEK